MAYKLLSTAEDLKAWIDTIDITAKNSPVLFVDLEGRNLSKYGTISLIQIMSDTDPIVYMVDVTIMKHLAFSTPNDKGVTLKTILESKDIIKVLFDLRMDAEALYHLYQVKLGGAEDLQLMAVANNHRSDRKWLPGLGSLLGYNGVKNAGKDLFAPERGGSYAVFDERPLKQAIIDYCVQDVRELPSLRRYYCQRLCNAWWNKIEEESNKRVEDAVNNIAVYNYRLGPAFWGRWDPSKWSRNKKTFLLKRKFKDTGHTAEENVEIESSTVDNDEIVHSHVPASAVRWVEY